MFISLIFGFIPGLGPVIVVILIIPVLDYFSEPTALLLLGSTFVVSTYGGSVSAILMNIPGTSSSAVTTLDGYPMSQKGRAITALSISTTSSITGGLISVLVILFSIPILSEIILLFGSPEYLLMVVLGIAVIAVVSRGDLVKGLLPGMFGLSITSIGVATTSGEIRYTLDILYLYDGVQYIPAIIGIFAVTEMVRLAGRGQQIAEGTDRLLGSPFEGIKQTFKYRRTLIRSSFIGMTVGLIPGAGGTVANFISYGLTTNFNKTEEDEIQFGEGNPEGIVAAEASNNAMVPGSFVPMVTFGIPGNATTAIMIGALLYIGVRPGPTLFSENIHLVYLLFFGVVIGSFFLIVMYWLAPIFGKVTTTNKSILIPFVLVFSTLSVYAIRYSFGDLIQLLLFSIFGYLMIQYNYSVISLTLGLILGPIAERNLFRTLQLSGGSLDIFLRRPLSLILMLLILFTISIPLIKFD
jgi:putative tricarboxylic transport membrane protein